jgi:glutaredoxin 3
MAAVRIFFKQGCPYSAGAKRLLEEKGIEFELVDVTAHPERRAELERLVGGRATLPQIFFGDRHVGGYTDLQELDRTSGLKGAALDADGDAA